MPTTPPYDNIDPVVGSILAALLWIGVAYMYRNKLKTLWRDYLGFKKRQDKTNDSNV